MMEWIDELKVNLKRNFYLLTTKNEKKIIFPNVNWKNRKFMATLLQELCITQMFIYFSTKNELFLKIVRKHFRAPMKKVSKWRGVVFWLYKRKRRLSRLYGRRLPERLKYWKLSRLVHRWANYCYRVQYTSFKINPKVLIGTHLL